MGPNQTVISTQLGPGLRASNWQGAGSFLRAVRSLNLPNVTFSQHYMWDTSRHAPPEQATPVNELPPEVAKFCQVAGLPRIPRDDWPRAFGYLEEFGHTQPFSLTEASKWPRDRSAESGDLIARAVFNFILTACHSQGTRLDAEPRPTAEAMANALLKTVLNRADLAGLDLSEKDTQILRNWLGLGS